MEGLLNEELCLISTIFLRLRKLQ